MNNDTIDNYDRQLNRLAAEAYPEFVAEVADWKSFLTLTFRDEKYPDQAKKKFLFMVRLLNERAFGMNYRKIVGHSYFSYCVGTEYQSREMIHFHVLVDAPVEYQAVHDIWEDLAGFAWIDQIKDLGNVVRYICKYVTKSGDLDIYKASRKFVPLNKPKWWRVRSHLT